MRFGIVLAMSLLVGACIRTATTTCADGTICRDGTVCAVAGDRTLCVTPEQLDGCNGLADLADCRSGDRCYEIDDGLVCLPITCGNGFTDPDREQCDDGDNVSDDGCSADCRSTEQCGNGVIDPLRGERCDDDNVVSHDGCSSRCDVEVVRWADHGFAGPQRGAFITYDARRARLVAFGGLLEGPVGSNIYSQATAEWDRAWTQNITPTAPGGRVRAAFAYDDVRGVAVRFGGARDATAHADTWEWTGTDWRTIDAAGPRARTDAALAYDSRNDRMVLFGGGVESKDYGDTWALHEGAWTLIAETGPPASSRVAMTFDPIDGVIAVVSKSDHWELDGATWTRIGSVPTDPDQPMWLVFDIALGRRLLLGDVAGQLKTWAWNGQVWSELVRATVPSTDVLGVVAERVHGGVIAVLNRGLAIWSGTGALVRIDNPIPIDPGVRSGAAAANDLRRREAIVFGGNQGNRTAPVRIDTMTAFDGLAWRTVVPATKPSPRWEHAMAYDVEHDRIVLFGGDAAAGLSRETWLWDGTTWTAAMPATAPSARSGHAMTYDRERGVVVLFGGRNATAPLADTWEWDGITWTPRSSMGVIPLPRWGASLAYDPVGGGVILFGGADAEGSPGFADTLRLTAAGWTSLGPVIVPSARTRGTLTWSPARRRLVLVGGEAFGPGPVARLVPVADSWEWDGARWRALPSTPRNVTQHVTIAAPDGTSIMTVGGNDLLVGGPVERVLVHRWNDSGAYETCVGRVDADGDGRAGCADPDCWSVCSPVCPPGMTGCPAAPACGDGACSVLETVWLCPQDCGPPPVSCGDLVCDGGETCVAECP